MEVVLSAPSIRHGNRHRHMDHPDLQNHHHYLENGMENINCQSISLWIGAKASLPPGSTYFGWSGPGRKTTVLSGVAWSRATFFVKFKAPVKNESGLTIDLENLYQVLLKSPKMIEKWSRYRRNPILRQKPWYLPVYG